MTSLFLAEEVCQTAGGAPVLVFDYAKDAPLHLVTVDHCAELRRAWVIGSPKRLMDFAGETLRLRVIVDRILALDEALPAIERIEA